ncbi:MAG: sn-glycerol-3-phosphate ABC transporter ATP-binding protein UgpC [Planctomycetota bacterium]|nr:sn-glycerol-3-phosphate ABC transporter ATP-binding protein UgpC [Planctomycetota bacterium]
MAEVVLESVSKTFPGGVVAVEGFDLHAGDGEFIVLVGPSGCGKTTTLRIIAGLEEPTAGTIRIAGRVVNRVHPKDRDIAMVFQDYALYPHMTVRKNLSFALKLRKMPRPQIEERVAETARLLGITELLSRRPKALSGGQQQRVAVGRAIVRSPKCYLFDEPLSNLDVKLRLQMRAELKALHLRLKTTTIYVTHDQEEAMTLGDRLVVMEGGYIQQVGAPLEVYREPINRFVAGFLGSPAMNFIDGRIERIDGRLRFVDGHDISLPLVGDLSRRAAERAGQAAVLGVRPEQFRSDPGRREAHGVSGIPGADGEAAIAFQVTVTEPLGDRMDVYGSTAGGATIVARVDAATLCRPGERTRFHVDPAAIHLFEPGEKGRRL